MKAAKTALLLTNAVIVDRSISVAPAAPDASAPADADVPVNFFLLLFDFRIVL